MSWETIDLCENAYEAADWKNQKAAMDSFDDTGVMALICHHDIPLFFGNIDSPGEQQKYSVALLQHLFSLLPPQVTVVALYDVGCMLAHRLRFATTAMHAYGHEWACQLVYNPCICLGLGLSDGEGTERLWSWLVQLIGVERSSSVAAIGLEMCSDLGDWIKRRLKHGVNDQGSTAQDILDQYTPARLKKELDTVLGLQADLDTSNRALQAMRVMLAKESHSDDTLEALESLKRGHNHLMEKVEILYSSLNIHDKFPELKGIDLDFVRILLMARDLKINIRKRAIAASSRTKLHQQTQKAIAKRQPALMTAIRKFNSYCEQLDSLYDPTCAIPLPPPLPTKLTELRADPTLMEDLWITPSIGEVPQWLDDMDVRGSIRALLKHEQCREEQVHLGTKANNLCEPFTATLEQHQSNFLQLQSHWSNSLASSVRFAMQVKEAADIAVAISGGSQSTALHWICTTRLTVPDLDGEDELVSADLDDLPQICLEQATLTDWDNNVPDTLITHIQPPHDGFPHQFFDPKDINLLHSPTACLNDVCINSCAALLYSELKAPTLSCVIFSTHDLPCICYNAPNDIVWRNTSWTHYWEKDIWVLLIHRPSDSIGHWVICVIHMVSTELHLFDSLGEQKPWKTDVKDIMKLIAWLFAVANKHDHHILTDLWGWVAWPLNIQYLQNNSYDCSLWVLATLTAVLHRRHVSGLQEDDIPCLRHYLCTLVLSLLSAVQ
ncbi:hypothetical protein CY34DRAFT_26825 [Suillus luteus UH-Slu-Lm8-n1]|uniref:Ubiquitin-like protease family profile domain-containing protein n=1 Tax=Suillus luteus UH-Slu-Lm8-n1 TaxID=930992 RepID=A0A0D0A8V9_9AGAM|nr:hypothetical protein CY34DRAFT_26825 [Suillus luteus UH-Slu-Lm8-n1]